MTRERRRWGGLAIAAALMGTMAGCGPDEADAPPAQIRLVAQADGLTYGDTPFPSDAARGSSGNLEAPVGLDRIVPMGAEGFGRHLEALDGFGLRPTVEFFVDGSLDPISIPSSTAAITEPIVVVELGSEGLGEPVPYDWRWNEARHVLAGAPVPGFVLKEGARYAAVVTRDVRSASGAPLEPPAVHGEWSADPAGISARWGSTAAALATLAADPRFDGGERIAGIALFTPQRATRTLVATRSQLASSPPSALTFDEAAWVFDEPAELDAVLGEAERDEDGQERWGWSNPTGIAHDHVAVLATGTLSLPRFRRADTGGDGPDDETFATDESGAAQLVETTSVPVSLVLPKGTPPPDGFPVAIFGHGLGASRHAVLTFAEPLTQAGFAVIAIDMDGHGSRFADDDEENNLAEVLPDFTGDASAPDGFGDVTGPLTTLGFVEGFANLSAFRDSIRQSVLDLSGVVRMLAADNYDLSPLAGPYGRTPTLDTRRIVYLGESYGSVVGSVFAAIEPDVDLFVLDVPGGGFLDLVLCEAPEMRAKVLPFIDLVYGVNDDLDRFHPMVSMAQSILDGADPLSYAPHVLGDRFTIDGVPLGPRHVVAIEAIEDEVMTNLSTDALGRAMGLAVLEPSFNAPPGMSLVASPASANMSGQTAVTVQYAPATHGANWTSERGVRHFYPPVNGARPVSLPAPIEIENPIYATLEQVVEVLVSHQAGGAPTVRSTLPPVADFDDDGTPDADEIAAGTDPFDPGS